MRKFVYLCGMILLSMNMMAQIDLDDQNWKPKLIEDFSTPGRYWIDTSWISSDSVWKAYSSGLTHGKNKMVYHYKQCHFNDVDGYMELIAEFDSLDIAEHQYSLPYNIHDYPSNTYLYYFSGRIDHYDRHGANSAKYRYGYFEIRCKLPIHQGAFPAFWLWHSDSTNIEAYYEEIDIFEFSWEFDDPHATWHHNPHPHYAGNPYCFTSGIYYCDTSRYHGRETSQARVFPMINDSLSHWHTFSCEWMPDHILWYCDENLVDEYYNSDSIPHHPLILKTNYGIDRYALEGYQHDGQAEWRSQDTMFIDYIKVYQLEWDCGTDEIIAQQSELDNFGFAVKKTIAITSTIEPVGVGSNKKVTFRATDSFEITGPFQVDSGGEMTVIMQHCPE